MATGSAGAAGTQGSSSQLQHCANPIGTAALVEEDSAVYHEYDMPSAVPMLRLMMQQSGCFQVVDRGAASAVLMRERELAGSGELQQGSNMGRGQLRAADFLITPRIVFQDANAGGAAGGLGGLLPGVVGFIAGGISVENMEAQTVLTLTNVRTGVQEAAAEGSATKSDMGFGGFGFGGGVGGAAGYYQSTDIGKIVTAAFMDAHNKLVQQVRATEPTQEREAVSNWRTTTNLNMRAGPSSEASVLTLIPQGTQVSPTGETNGDWWQIEANGAQGWVSRNYLAQF